MFSRCFVLWTTRTIHKSSSPVAGMVRYMFGMLGCHHDASVRVSYTLAVGSDIHSTSMSVWRNWLHESCSRWCFEPWWWCCDDAAMPWCHLIKKVDILVMITVTITIKIKLTQATSQCEKVPWSLHCWGGNWHWQVGLWISAGIFILTWQFFDPKIKLCLAKLNESFWRPKIPLINVYQVSLNVRKGREVAVACWRGENQLQVFWKTIWIRF